MKASMRSGLEEPRDFSYALFFSLINEQIWGEIQGLCLLRIVQVVRGAISSKVDVMAVGRLTVDDSRERGEFMLAGSMDIGFPLSKCEADLDPVFEAGVI